MIKVLKNEGVKLSVLLEGLGNSYANALRKSSNEIPILAVDEVEISKNDSALFDEMLAHRLGLLPLSADKTFTLPEECTCKGKGCSKCTAELTLKVSGEGTVLAKSLKSKTVEPIYSEMPLVYLQKDQEIELVAKARLGKGKDHAKHSPGLVWIRAASDEPENEIGKENTKEPEGEDFVLEIESWGQLKPKEILAESCGALKENLDEFLKEASKIK